MSKKRHLNPPLPFTGTVHTEIEILAVVDDALDMKALFVNTFKIFLAQPAVALATGASYALSAFLTEGIVLWDEACAFAVACGSAARCGDRAFVAFEGRHG